jgi:hypothetical protein
MFEFENAQTVYTYLLEFLLYFTQQFSNKRILNKITMPHQIDVSKLFAEK